MLLNPSRLLTLIAYRKMNVQIDSHGNNVRRRARNDIYSHVTYVRRRARNKSTNFNLMRNVWVGSLALIALCVTTIEVLSVREITLIRNDSECKQIEPIVIAKNTRSLAQSQTDLNDFLYHLTIGSICESIGFADTY